MALVVGLTTNTRWVGRVYVQFAQLPSISTYIIETGAGDTGPGVYFNQTDSKLYARVGTTSGATGVVISTSQWYRVDFDFNIQTAGNDVCDVQVDGTICGQATATGISASQTQIAIGVSGAASVISYWDDVILSNTAADYPLGAGYVNHFVPTADGTHNVAGTGDFQRTVTATDILNATTDAYQLVDDVPLESGASVDWINMAAPVNATDYVECVFGPAPGISTPTTAPRTVEVIAGIHQATTATGNMEIRLNDNGTMGTVYTATTVAGVTSVAYKRAHFADPPSAATVWTLSGNGNFNNLRVRFGSPAALDVVPDQYFDCIMVEAEFAGVFTPPDPIAEIFNFQQRMTAAHRASSY